MMTANMVDYKVNNICIDPYKISGDDIPIFVKGQIIPYATTEQFKALHNEYMDRVSKYLSTLYDEWCKGIVDDDEYDEEVAYYEMEADEYAASVMGVDKAITALNILHAFHDSNLKKDIAPFNDRIGNLKELKS